MRFSIRSFLIINLLLSVALITSLMVIANLYLNHDKLQKHTDAQLILDALTIEAFINNNPSHYDLKTMQSQINLIPDLWHHLRHKAPSLDKNLAQRIAFQVTGRDNKVLLSSYKNLPKPQITGHSDFRDILIDKAVWRTFTTYNHLNGMSITTAERYDFHQDLETQIATNAIVILLLALPLLGLLLWLVVGRGLASIKEVTKEVKNRDPTELKMLEPGSIPAEIKPLVEELNLLFKKVDEAFLHEERFSSDAAHELRTPLAALRAHVNVALNATTNDERNNALEKIKLGIDRGTHVVQQLLTLSRTSKTRIHERIKSGPTNIKKVASQIIAELYPLALDRKIDIELIAPSETIIITGDEIMLGILLKNLIDNSIRYIDHGGLIQVVVANEQDKAIIKVIDDGPGIPKKIRNQVFERFFRGGNSSVPGSGLGLSIVQQIASYHNAKIDLKTPPSGKGLEVDIIFPQKN